MPGASWSTRRKVFIALGVVMVTIVSYLAGSGWDLGALTGGADGIDDGSGLVGEWASAETVAVDDDGAVRAAVEVAPSGAADGACVRVRLGDDVVAQRCSTGALLPWDAPDFAIVRLDDYFGSIEEHAIAVDGTWVVALSGAVHPDVIRVTAHFGDGVQYSFVTRNEGGWFVAVLPDDVADPSAADGRLVNAPVRLELFDVDGTRVASVDLASDDPPG